MTVPAIRAGATLLALTAMALFSRPAWLCAAQPAQAGSALAVRLSAAPGYQAAGKDKNTPVFYEDLNTIYIHFRARQKGGPKSVRTRFLLLEAEGFRRGKKLLDFNKQLDGSNETRHALEIQPYLLTPGKYRLEFTTENNPAQQIDFKIIPRHPWAGTADSIEPRAGYNLLNRRLGGKVVAYSSQYDDSKWGIHNINDGIRFKVARDSTGARFCTLCGWQSAPGAPAQITFAFRNNQSATIDTVIIDTAAYPTLRDMQGIPKLVEIWASDSAEKKDFKKLHTARLRMAADEQVISLKPTRMKYLKIVFVNAHTQNFFRVAEIKALEHDSRQHSIVQSTEINIADPATGTYLVSYTSDATLQSVFELVDGKVSAHSGWVSGNSSRGKQDYLPQDFVFGFKNRKRVYIDRVVFNPLSGSLVYNIPDKKAAWVKKVAIYVSSESTFRNFTHVKTVELEKKGTEQSFKLGVDARYIKFRLIENHGGPYTSLGELKLIEGRKPGYHSVMIEHYGRKKSTLTGTQLLADPGDTAKPPTASRTEHEPNDTFAKANLLGPHAFTSGMIKPLLDLDYFNLEQPAGDRSANMTLTTLLQGTPYINTSLTLYDHNKKPVRKFDPSQSADKQVRLSWYLPRQQYYYRLNSVPASVILMWDTSGSMKGRAKQVMQAVQKFIRNKPDDMQLNLIRFGNGSVETLLPDFSADKKRLLEAIDGKFKPDGATPLYDAIHTGVELLSAKKGNRALVILSDGADTQSKLKHHELWPYLERHKVRIYTIGLGIELKIFLPRLLSTGQQILNHIAGISGGTAYFTPDPKQLDAIYQAIGTELTHPPGYLLLAHPSRGLGSLQLVATGEHIPAVSAPTHIELIVDASGSMRRKMGDLPKIDIAKTVLTEIVNELPDKLRVALRVYGDRIREGKDGDCEDTRLLHPFRGLHKAELVRQIKSLRALGTTPIAYSLEQLQKDFARTKGEKLVILVTDGREECDGDPVATVRRMKKQGLRFRLNVIGFTLKNRRLIRQMKALAAAGGGRYFSAQNYHSLKTSLADAMAVTYQVLDSSNTLVKQGRIDRGAVQVPEGIYTVKLNTRAGKIKIDNVCITVDDRTVVELKKEGAEVGVTKKIPPQGLCARR